MGQVDPTERRRFWRASFHSDAVVKVSGHLIKGHLLDISIRGALVEMLSDHVVDPQTPCSIKLALANDAKIEMQGTIVHQHEKNIGIRCEQIDIDSMTHLRRLIELNSGDSTQLERDLSTLIVV